MLHPSAGQEKDKDSTFHYKCPFCEAAISSRICSGRVDNRRHCGHRFRVKDGRVAEKEMVYECPFCAGKVESNVRTGRLDHRNVCGNQFYVKNGNINNATRQHAHTCPQCLAVVWSARAAGQIRVQHNAPSGGRCPRNSWTAMPAPEQARKDDKDARQRPHEASQSAGKHLGAKGGLTSPSDATSKDV